MPNGAKNWCFTLNNYTEQDVARYRDIGSDRESITYFVFGREVGEHGTSHLQCFVSFAKRRTLRQVKDLFGSRVHCEAARGSPSQNQAYCTKDGQAEEFGNLPKGRGNRNDLSAALAAVKAGASRRVLIEEHAVAYSRAHRMLSEALILYSGSRDWMPITRVYYGETGIGKTRKAFEEAQSDVYVHSGGQWFDGYDGNEDVIFDDFGGSEFKLTYLLKLLDRYPMKVPVKGGFVNWVPKRIWITANYSPSEWYPNAKDMHVAALIRRFEKVVRFRRLSSILAPHGDSEEEIVII